MFCFKQQACCPSYHHHHRRYLFGGGVCSTLVLMIIMQKLVMLFAVNINVYKPRLILSLVVVETWLLMEWLLLWWSGWCGKLVDHLMMIQPILFHFHHHIDVVLMVMELVVAVFMMYRPILHHFHHCYH